MPKKIKPLSFEEAVSQLRSLQFDVQQVAGDSNRVRVSKYDCAAELARDAKGGVVLAHKPGIVLGGEIAVLLDRGFQKFFKTSKLEMAATAERLKAEYRFTQELDEATGGVSLYNESLGTTSDTYMYDRLKGRNGDWPGKGRAPWAQAGASGH
jgi:hypothetical protein